MAFYVRKITRSKWSQLDKASENILENYPAEVITNDIQAKGNDLSLWKIEDLSDENMEKVIVINSLLSDTIRKIELIIIPEEMLDDFILEQEDGDTVAKNYRNLHYNIKCLTIQKHLQFANDVMLKIVNDENDIANNKNLIRRIDVSKQKRYIKDWINKGEIKIDDIESEIKESQNKKIRCTNKKLEQIQKWISEDE